MGPNLRIRNTKEISGNGWVLPTWQTVDVGSPSWSCLHCRFSGDFLLTVLEAVPKDGLLYLDAGLHIWLLPPDQKWWL